MNDAPDVNEWLAHAMTQKWVAWLEDQADFQRRQLPGIVANGHPDQATALAGSIKAYEDILGALSPDVDTQEVAPEMPFIDPAERPSLRKS